MVWKRPNIHCMSLFSSMDKSSYLQVRRLNLFLFTYEVPSYVAAKVSHICLTLLKLCTFVYSSSENTHNITFLALGFSKNLRFCCLFGLLASVPIVVVGFTFIKEFISTRTRVYLIHSDKGYQFNSYVQI